MYEILCGECGQIGFHLSRTGAESRAELHNDELDYECEIVSMAGH